MAITPQEYAEKIFYRLGRGGANPPVTRASIEATLPEALEALARLAANSPNPAFGSLLEKTFALTLSGGESSLASHPTLMVDLIPTVGRVMLAGVTRPLQWLPYRPDLDNPPPISSYIYYTLFDDKIVVRTHTGAIPPQTALTIFGPFVPTAAEVDDILVPFLIEIGIKSLMLDNEEA